MQILFAISVVCCLALVWAAIALTRRIRTSRRSREHSSHHRRDFAQHLLDAVEEENIPEPRKVPYQTFRDITAKKSWNQPPELITIRPKKESRLALPPTADQQFQGKRKSPQPALRAGPERLDWAHFNKDMGDLTDPYQAPSLRANSRISLRRN
jgi:hypothetical protein